MKEIVQNTTEWENKILEKIEDKEYRKDLLKRGIKVTVHGEEDFPKAFYEYEKMPKFIFYKGNLPNFRTPIVSIIGARACSNYGRKTAKELARDFSNNGVQVVSGLAMGIDSFAAIGALEGKTPTFAVLGCGVDMCYPTENIALCDEIIKQGGGIISEYPPGDEPLRWHFPARNRIISALSDAVIVVEARKRSGSLITVEWALEQGKDVYAVPGRISDKMSEGCNKLIKSGANMITSVGDVIEDIYVEASDNPNISVRKDLAKLYACVEDTPKSTDQIMQSSGLSLEETLNQLMQLQMLGLVKEVSTGLYVLN